jgi:hypothetical protein
MSLFAKSFVCLIVALMFLGLITTSLGEESFFASYYRVQNSSYLNFNQEINFTTTPSLGIPYDNSLVGYWNMNAASGELLNDTSGKNNNGKIDSAAWVEGKFGNALNFNGINSCVKINDSLTISPSEITVACWVNYNIQQNGGIVTKFYDYGIYGPEGNFIKFVVWDGISSSSANFNKELVQTGIWHFIVGTYGLDRIPRIYLDGQLVGYGAPLTNGIRHTASTEYIGRRGDGGGADYFNGQIDDVRIYNRSLSAHEVTALFSQPDPDSLSNYYSFEDPSTNNTMIIGIDNAYSSNNDTLVTCTNFFSNQQLIFRSNDSQAINIWTNLGRPTFTTGIWNNNNYTTTLILDSTSTDELNWEPSKPPFVSNVSLTSTNAGKLTVFSALWSDNLSLSGGGYIFSTNNTGQWSNASWAPFNSIPRWGNTSFTFNNNIGSVISFREYVNNSLNIWGDSGVYNFTVTTILPAPTSTPNLTPTPLPPETVTSSPNPITPTIFTTPVPTSFSPEAKNNPFPIEIVAIITSVVALAILLAYAFIKGCIVIDVVDLGNASEKKNQNLK